LDLLKRSRGFTLIELIVIVIILGIIAAVALPRYLELKTEAQIGTAKGILGTLRGANVLLYSRYILNGTSAPYSMIDIIANANIQGVGATAVSAATYTANIGGTIYTFSLTAPILPTTPGQVYVATTTW